MAIDWLADKAGDGLGLAGKGISGAWKPFGYAFDKDQDASQWIAAQVLNQFLRAAEAKGVTSSEGQRFRQAFRHDGARQAWQQQEIDPITRFLMESVTAPSTLVTAGAGLAPKMGARAIARGAQAGPAAAPFVRGAQTLRAAPATFKAASPVQRVGMAANAADRFMGLPFEAAAGVTRQARPGSLARQVPAINNLFSLHPEFRAKIASRNIINAFNSINKAGVSSRQALGLDTQQVMPTMGGAPNPGGANPVVPQMEAPIARQPSLSDDVRPTAPGGRVIGPERQFERGGQAAGELDGLYDRLRNVSDDAEAERLYDEIVRLEGEQAAPAAPVADALSPDDALREIEDQAEFNLAFDEMESPNRATTPDDLAGRQAAGTELEPRPEPQVVAGDEPRQAGAAQAAVDPWNDPTDPINARQAARDATDMEGRRLAIVHHARQGGGRGNMGFIVRTLESAGVDLPRIDTLLHRLFGGVLPDQKRWAGTPRLGWMTAKERAEQKAGMRAAGKSSDAVNAWEDGYYADYTTRVLAAQTDERLYDLLEYLDSKRYYDGLVSESSNYIEGFRYLDHPDAIKQRIQVQYGVKPEPMDDLGAVAGGSDAPEPDADDPLWQALPGHQRPARHPDIGVADDVIDLLREYQPQLVDSLEEWERDQRAALHIFKTAKQSHASLADLPDDASAAVVVDALKGVIPTSAHESLSEVVGKWDRMGVDILRASEQQAVGTAMTIKIAREIAPKLFDDPNAIYRWLGQVLPQMWKEQALATPRYLLGNVADILPKSLMHGQRPFYRPKWEGKLRRGQKITAEVPNRVQAAADELEVPVPADVMDSVREALVGDRRAYVINKRGSSAFRELWENYNPIAFVSEANMEVTRSVDVAARSALWEQGMKEHLAKVGPDALEMMLRRVELLPQQEELIRRVFTERNYYVGPERAAKMLREAGVRERVVNDFTKHWRNAIHEASGKGVKVSNHIHFDYADRNNLDKWVAKVIPFHFWASRNIPYYLEHLAEQPWLAAAWMRYDRIAEEERKKQHLPGRFRGFLTMGGSGIIGGLFGVAGQLAANPLAMLSVTSQVNPGVSFDKDDDTQLGEGLDFISKWTGLGPGPYADLALNVTGQFGSTPFDPNVTRLGPLAEQAGIPTPDRLLTRGANVVRGALTGQDTSSLSGSQYRDRLIRQRIMELADEEGEGPNDVPYLMAVNDPNTEIWKRAEDQVKQQSGASNLLSAVSPIPMKYATDTSIEVQEARDTVEEAGLGYPEGGDETPEARQEREAAIEALSPRAAELLDLYSAVGQMGSSPETTELRRQMELWGIFRERYASSPGSLRGRAYDDFFTKYPLIRQYLDWYSREAGRGRDFEDASSFDLFLEAQRRGE